MPALYALRLSRDVSGAVTIDEVEYLAPMGGAYRPLGRYTGELVARSLAGETLIDAVPVSFPTSFVLEGFGEDLDSATRELGEIEEPTTRIHLAAAEGVDRIDIVDSDGNVLASRDTLPPRETGALRSSRPFAAYPWIELLDENDSNSIIREAVASTLYTLSDAQIRVLQSTLDAMPRRLVSAIDTLGVGFLPNPGLTYGGHVLLDFEALSYEPGRLYHLLSHEAAHAYHNASVVAGGGSFEEWASDWSPELESAIRDTHRQFGFERNLVDFWSRLHESAVDANIASPYTGDAGATLDAPHLQGFVSSYAASSVTEDIADTVAIANMGTTRSLTPVFSSRACTGYQLRDELDRSSALAYVKLQLVRLMGLARQEDVEWCVDDVAPVRRAGIHLGDALLFDRELNAGYTSAAREQFNVVGQDGEGRGLAIELRTDGRLPVGVYPLDTTWWGSWDGANTLVIASPNDLEARTAVSGVVVISYADSSDRVDGFVFDLALYSAFGPASEFAYVPFRIPF